jgi:tRNA(Ile)-lysidine synthase
MALLDVLQRGGYDCVVAHCNFHLRGEESDRDEQVVRQSALLTTKDHRSIPLYVKHFDTIAYAQEQRCSIEVAARNLRYEWFAQLAQELECQAIAVAHHQNDQAETVLLNLRRGTGIRGLCGMRAKSKNPVAESDIPVIRPLLCTTHQYILHYLRDIRKIEWAEDSSNTDTSFTRNAIRQEIAHYTQAEIEHIATTAEHMQGYVDWIEERQTDAAEQMKLYERLREYHFPEPEKIFRALKKGEGGKTFVSPTHKATIKKGQVCITSES